MNDTWTPNEEQELRRLLQQRAATARPSVHARQALFERLEQPSATTRARRRVAVAGAAAIAAVTVWTQTTSPVLLTAGDDGGRDPSAESSPVTTAPPAPAPATARPLPRLVLAQDGRTVDHVEEHEGDGSLVPTGEVYTQVFRQAGGAPSAPSLTIHSIDAGAAFGIGEEAPARAVERVDVNGRVGYLLGRTALSPSLGWRLADGTAVHLKAVALPGESLVDIARGMERRATGEGWNVPLSSLAPVAEGEVDYAGARSSEVQYVGDRGRAAVRVFDGDRLRFEELLLDRADAATTIETIEIRGREGALLGIDDGYLAVWFEDGVVGEVVSSAGRDQTLEALASLREVTEEEWRSLPGRSGR